MNIPIEVVRQGEEAINKYMELEERKEKLYSTNSKSMRSFFDQIAHIKQSIKSFENMHLHRSNPFFSEKENKWVLPEIKELSQFTDEIWTFQKNLETSLSDITSGTYEFIKVSEELDKLY